MNLAIIIYILMIIVFSTVGLSILTHAILVAEGTSRFDSIVLSMFLFMIAAAFLFMAL